MFHTNDDSKHEQWRALAREGDEIEAIKIYRSINGSSLMEAKNAVEAWIAAQPEGVCKAKIVMSDEQALTITLNMARIGVMNSAFGEEHRRAKKAIERTEWLFPRTLDNDKEAKTGPYPPASHSDKAGHHWLRNDNQHGGLGDIVVMQWQPEQQKWCHSGRVATGSAVDTGGLDLHRTLSDAVAGRSAGDFGSDPRHVGQSVRPLRRRLPVPPSVLG